jgi:phosphonatase-like hydrolase
MKDIKLVVFDMAGTTVNDDSAVNGCLRASLAAAGVAADPRAVNSLMGLPKPEAIAILIERSQLRDALRDEVEAVHRDFVARSTKFYRSDPSVHEVPGTTRVFEILKKAGISVALNTGFDRSITDVILDRLNWSKNPLIDATICSDEVSRGRPHPEMIRELMARLSVAAPRKVAKVGDTPADLQEGHNAGCGLIVGVTGGTHTRVELEPYPHTCLIESIAEIPGVLGIELF